MPDDVDFERHRSSLIILKGRLQAWRYGSQRSKPDDVENTPQVFGLQA